MKERWPRLSRISPSGLSERSREGVDRACDAPRIDWSRLPCCVVLAHHSDGMDIKNHDEPRSPAYPCPCCGYLTLPGPPGTDEICTICMWLDNVAQLRSPTLRNGTNRSSLLEAQSNFRTFGASDLTMRSYSRAPRPQDRCDPQWRPLDPVTDELEPPAQDVRNDAPDGDPTALYYWRKSVGKRTA